MSLANRRVIFDGGSQDRPEGYWLSRALFATEERVALRILRMINSQGDQALDYLRSLGFYLPESVGLLSDMLQFDQSIVEPKLSNFLTAEQTEQLRRLVYGQTAPPPTYLMIYKDMVDQNVAIQLIAGWNFKKAYEKKIGDEGKQPSWSRAIPSRSKDYVNETLALSQRFRRYTAEAKLKERNGDTLIFSNGLSLDLNTKEGWVNLPNKGFKGRPISLLYWNGNQLVEKDFSGEQVNASAFLIQDGNVYTSVLAERELLRSLLYQLYYLKGKGFQFIKFVTSVEDPKVDNVIRLFEIDWSAFIKSERSTSKATTKRGG